MNYISTYQYTEINAIELEIPKYCIRFLFKSYIVRKIGILRELIVVRKRAVLSPPYSSHSSNSANMSTSDCSSCSIRS